MEPAYKDPRADPFSIRKAINGALKSCIHEHGPITFNYIPSASKRIEGTLVSLWKQRIGQTVEQRAAVVAGQEVQTELEFLRKRVAKLNVQIRHLNRVCTINGIFPPRQRKEAEMSMKEIGEKIKESVDLHRDSAAMATTLAQQIDEAWGKWDVDALLDLGAISEQDAEFIKSCAVKGPLFEEEEE